MSAVAPSVHASALVGDLIKRTRVLNRAYGRPAANVFADAMAPLLAALGAVAVPSNAGPAEQPGYADLLLVANHVRETATEVHEEILSNCALFASRDDQRMYAMAMTEAFAAAAHISGGG
jgi:hypothetical protein